MKIVGQVDLLSRNAIAGWVADADRPDLSVPLRLTVNGRKTGITPQEMRDDLVSAFPGSTGKYSFRIVDNLLPLSPFIDNHVEVAVARTGETIAGGQGFIKAIGSRGVQHASDFLKPVVLTTTGRSGSSLLMARLARHTGLIVGRDHPYELKLLSYYAKSLSVLTAEADRQRSTEPDSMLSAANRFFVGFNPFNEPFEKRNVGLGDFWNEFAPDTIRECFSTLIDTHYRCVAQMKDRGHAKYFVEKIGSSELVREATGFMFGETKELLLVRDPRDIVCSSKSFWKKDFLASILALKGQFVSMLRPRSSSWLRQHVVKYESLVTDPDKTMSEVIFFLGLSDRGYDTDKDEEDRVFKTHGTSGSPQETLGRWRHELSSEEVTVANRELGFVLEAFGYGLT